MTEITRAGLVREAENGVTITRQQLAATLQRLPRPANALGDGWPYSQDLLLSFLACQACDSCSRADNGGGRPCDCPVPCGARYCQHGAPGRKPDDRDEELEAIAAMLRILDGLDDVSGTWRQSVVRTLTYIASRFGYVLAEREESAIDVAPGESKPCTRSAEHGFCGYNPPPVRCADPGHHQPADARADR